MDRPKASLFDLDDTLADSFKAPKPEMVRNVAELAARMPVAILSGASFERMRDEILDPVAKLEASARLFAFPDSASACHVLRNGAWERAYSIEFSDQRLQEIKAAVEASAEECGLSKDNGRALVLLESTQVRYAALGLNATEEEKNTWDPDRSKRRLLKKLLDDRLPDCEVLIGGRTTIDITRKGVDKAYGVRWLSEHLGIPPQEMFYVGDALYEGGNDQVVIATGIQAKQTSGPEETFSIVEELLHVSETS